MDHDLARVVQRTAPFGTKDGNLDHGAEARTVDEATRGVTTYMRGDLVAPGSTTAWALLVALICCGQCPSWLGSLGCEQHQFPFPEGTPAASALPGHEPP